MKKIVSLLSVAMAVLLWPISALAQGGPSVSLRYTADTLSNAAGGIHRGTRYLHKAELIFDWTSSADFRVFVDMGHINGVHISGPLVGDAQGVDGNEGFQGFDVFDAWIGRSFPNLSAQVIAGLIDTNTYFDTQEIGGLFVHGSHGMGPEFSHSGATGPSTYPLVSPGLVAEKVFGADRDRAVTVRLGAWDGTPGNPDDPDHFAVRVGGKDGLLLVGQGELGLGSDASFQLGLWHYTAAQGLIGGEEREAASDHGDSGAYARLEGPVAKIGRSTVIAWVRTGIAASRFNAMDNYLGGGFVLRRSLSGGSSDEFGLSVASAGFSRRYRSLPEIAGHTTPRETAVEFTYRTPEWHGFAVQPDVQWIHRPSGDDHIHDAFVLGLRLELNLHIVGRNEPKSAEW